MLLGEPTTEVEFVQDVAGENWCIDVRCAVVKEVDRLSSLVAGSGSVGMAPTAHSQPTLPGPGVHHTRYASTPSRASERWRRRSHGAFIGFGGRDVHPSGGC